MSHDRAIIMITDTVESKFFSFICYHISDLDKFFNDFDIDHLDEPIVYDDLTISKILKDIKGRGFDGEEINLDNNQIDYWDCMAVVLLKPKGLCLYKVDDRIYVPAKSLGRFFDTNNIFFQLLRHPTESHGDIELGDYMPVCFEREDDERVREKIREEEKLNNIKGRIDYVTMGQALIYLRKTEKLLESFIGERNKAKDPEN